MGVVIPLFGEGHPLAESDSAFVHEFMEDGVPMLQFRLMRLDEVEDEDGLRRWIRAVKADVAGWPE